MSHQLAILGGPKACDVTWPAWPVWSARERRALLDVLDSGAWWYGKKVAEFERAFAAFQGARFGVTASSGSTALEATLLALGLEAGDEVIIPPYTFMATATAVIRVNAIPVFADILPDTLCLDPADVARKITRRTRAIMPVHLAGHVADMDRLGVLARRHKLRLIEDACHSWGAQWKGRGTGSLGDAGVFSFQVSKNITSAEGGIALSNDEALADGIRSYTNCGRRKGGPWYAHAVAGTNLRLTEFQAALLLAQLTRLERQTLHRQAAAQFLDRELAGIPGLRLVRTDPRITRRACHLYVMRVDPSVLGVSRDVFVKALNAEGVKASAGYGTPLYRMEFFRHGKKDPGLGCRPFAAADRDYAGVHCPVAEDICRNGVWLGQTLLLATRSALRKLAAAIRKVAAHAAELKDPS
jgi:dTDP-4-amino-4,6-dideoxygalactose transaminase